MPDHNRYARWEDAMITQGRILSWYGSRDGLRYLSDFFTDMNLKHRPEGRRDPRLLAAIQVNTLREAEPIYVSPEALDLIDHARHTFHPEPVRPSDPFCPSGFALLPRPILIDDAPPTEANPMRSPNGLIPVRAIAWGTTHSEDYQIGAFWISYYSDFEDELEMGIDERAPGDELTTSELIDSAKARSWPMLSLVHQWQWSWHSNPWVNPDELDVLPGDDLQETMARAKAQTQLIQCFWRIAGQFLPSSERASAPRNMRREAARRGLVHSSEVNIVRLRRRRVNHEQLGEGERASTVRHLVHGYWGTRHYRDGARQVWVDDYVRGDENKEFVLKDRVWEFTR